MYLHRIVQFKILDIKKDSWYCRIATDLRGKSPVIMFYFYFFIFFLPWYIILVLLLFLHISVVFRLPPSTHSLATQCLLEPLVHSSNKIFFHTSNAIHSQSHSSGPQTLPYRRFNACERICNKPGLPEWLAPVRWRWKVAACWLSLYKEKQSGM